MGEEVNDPFEKLAAQLEQETWPMVYLFKFIVPKNPETLAKVVGLFETQNEMAFRDSGQGNYTSITVKEMMMDVESVIKIYRKAAEMKGVIAL